MHIKRSDEHQVDLDKMKHGEVHGDAGGSNSFFGFPVSDSKECPRDETRNCRPLCLSVARVARQGPVETAFEGLEEYSVVSADSRALRVLL